MSRALRDRLPREAPLRPLAGALAYLVAALHLFHPTHGVARLVLVLSVNPGLLIADPRPLAFALSGLAILGGVTVVVLGVPARRYYAVGIALMAVYVAGYLAWHLSGHGGFLPGREPLSHGLTPLEAVLAHLRTDPWARVAIPAEVALAVVMAVLLRRER